MIPCSSGDTVRGLENDRFRNGRGGAGVVIDGPGRSEVCDLLLRTEPPPMRPAWVFGPVDRP